MKRLVHLSAVLALMLLASCGPSTNDKEEYVIKTGTDGSELRVKLYYDGKIEYIQQMKDGKIEGYFANFTQKGRLKNTGTMKQGMKEGAGIIFYPDGSVKSVGEYRNDEENGLFWLFKDKQLLEKREYIYRENKSRMNQWMRFTPDMQVNAGESNFVSLKAHRDTIRKGDTYSLAISLEASYNNKYMAAIIGPFNENYDLPPGAKCDTLVARNFVAGYSTKEYKSGLNTIRGVVHDISANPGDSDSKVRHIYFSKDFWVLK